jgi:hypothetical protein
VAPTAKSPASVGLFVADGNVEGCSQSQPLRSAGAEQVPKLAGGGRGAARLSLLEYGHFFSGSLAWANPYSKLFDDAIMMFNKPGDTHMATRHTSTAYVLRSLFLGLLLLPLAAPLTAQTARTITMTTPITAPEARATAQFRAQFDTMMANYERMATKQGNLTTLEKASEARLAMSKVTEQQLAILYSRTGYPDLSSAVIVSELLASRPMKEQSKSLPFPGAAAIVSQCNSVDYSPGTRYAELIAKEVTSSILAAATFACVETILGENGSLVCEPFAIANDIAQGLFNVATFCAGEAGGNQVDASYQRLEHLHNDLTAGISSIVSNDNSNKTAIITNDNTNTANIVSNDNSNKTAIITNDNTNTTNIINNDNANKTALVTLANANTATIVNNDNTNTANIVNNDNANKTAIINNDNANKTAIIANDNANTATLVAEIRALGCEIVRLLNTPDGQRASAILACSAAPGFPYSWNKK